MKWDKQEIIIYELQKGGILMYIIFNDESGQPGGFDKEKKQAGKKYE